MTTLKVGQPCEPLAFLCSCSQNHHSDQPDRLIYLWRICCTLLELHAHTSPVITAVLFECLCSHPTDHHSDPDGQIHNCQCSCVAAHRTTISTNPGCLMYFWHIMWTPPELHKHVRSVTTDALLWHLFLCSTNC